VFHSMGKKLPTDKETLLELEKEAKEVVQTIQGNLDKCQSKIQKHTALLSEAEEKLRKYKSCQDLYNKKLDIAIKMKAEITQAKVESSKPIAQSPVSTMPVVTRADVSQFSDSEDDS